MTARNAASINLADYDWCEVFMFACTGRCDSNGCDGVLDEARAAVNDPVSHPAHYTAPPVSARHGPVMSPTRFSPSPVSRLVELSRVPSKSEVRKNQ